MSGIVTVFDPNTNFFVIYEKTLLYCVFGAVSNLEKTLFKNVELGVLDKGAWNSYCILLNLAETINIK